MTSFTCWGVLQKNSLAPVQEQVMKIDIFLKTSNIQFSIFRKKENSNEKKHH